MLITELPQALRSLLESMIRYSKSGFSINALKTRCQTPFLAHWRKRWNTLFQLPIGRARTVHHSFWNDEALTRQKVDRALFEIDDEASA